MKLSTLKYFVAVATAKSFTGAAQHLYISQPTLSRRIQELEHELGTELFIRQSHSLELSAAGEQFLVGATDVLTRVDRLSNMFKQQQPANQPVRLLKIGYLANFNLGKMYTILNQFKEQHPNVQFLLNQDLPTNLVDGLTDGRYDLVFNLDSYFQAQSNILKTFFMANHLQIALPLDHPLKATQPVKFADLRNETFILLERQQSPLIVDYVINQGLQNGFNLKANYYVKNLDEGLSMVALGKGLAFLYSGMNDDTLTAKYQIKIADLVDVTHTQNIVAAVSTQSKVVLVNELYGSIARE